MLGTGPVDGLRFQRFQEFLDGQSGFANQVPQQSGTEFAVEGYAQNHGVARLKESNVAATLSVLNPDESLEGLNRFLARADRQFHGERATSTSATSIWAGRPWAFRVSRLR